MQEPREQSVKTPGAVVAPELLLLERTLVAVGWLY